jgi:hypothetical protein
MVNDIMFHLQNNYLYKKICEDLIKEKEDLIPYTNTSFVLGFEGNERPYRPGVYVIWLNGICFWVGQSGHVNDGVDSRLRSFIGRCNGTRFQGESHSAGDYIYENFTRQGITSWKEDLTVSVLSKELYHSLIEHNGSLIDLETYCINVLGAARNKQQTSNFRNYIELKHENVGKVIEYANDNDSPIRPTATLVSFLNSTADAA